MTLQNEASPGKEEALVLIEELLAFALRKGMVQGEDVAYARNALLDLFRLTEPTDAAAGSAEPADSAVELLEPLLDYGFAIGLIPDNTVTQRDLLDARIMGLLMPRPSETTAAFRGKARDEGIAAATDAFYALNIDSNYIRMDRIRKNQYWQHPTPYGGLEMTINLSKPEKDPKEIALLKTLPQAHYPKCLLCAENVGYAGRADHPARQNLRILPMTLQDEPWFFQYSPYVYYNEHSIVFKGAHEPMAVTHASFARLLDFVEQFPHYFIGSNADLPIVGGSILSHDHFQAGRHVFPMESAPIEASFADELGSAVTYGIVQWPMSVLRLRGSSKAAVHAAGCRILDRWKAYSDPSADVLAYSELEGGERIRHNTITPIARLKDSGDYELDLVLRNNRTSEEHPGGIFHPHSHLHHIKKENIGLIEVMGLAVLPGRLKEELEQIAELLTPEAAASAAELRAEGHKLAHHADWAEMLERKYGTSLSKEEAGAAVRSETGDKFLDVLLDAGVFKRNEQGAAAFRTFLAAAELKPV
ncbi:UDP-glucose--hexose-1-phosphate uridylyltransferase [Paenibacillus sp. LHD-117]|uniref:UDP-glucose--hexose-1-phosphate uridylyltransferase n=1 Tax=Paenibacillus sp. LHD-117 TaxID=3071412 RepID=UPI0027E04EA6|nr:UDP-glucose--hexose-1-phosphate uridylyltransferase [Paenibacillus sp. LHD-117]MDQ6420080.1 UDP-glucose--hexose-1-phosphate uridylyltransferase [Paenibacillus sp. LHD-117]